MIEQPNEEDGRFVITGEELFVIAAALKPDDGSLLYVPVAGAKK